MIKTHTHVFKFVKRVILDSMSVANTLSRQCGATLPRAQSEPADGGLNENIRKTLSGVFLLLSFAREARRTAPL